MPSYLPSVRLESSAAAHQPDRAATGVAERNGQLIEGGVEAAREAACWQSGGAHAGDAAATVAQERLDAALRAHLDPGLGEGGDERAHDAAALLPLAEGDVAARLRAGGFVVGELPC